MHLFGESNEATTRSGCKFHVREFQLFFPRIAHLFRFPANWLAETSIYPSRTIRCSIIRRLIIAPSVLFSSEHRDTSLRTVRDTYISADSYYPGGRRLYNKHPYTLSSANKRLSFPLLSPFRASSFLMRRASN